MVERRKHKFLRILHIEFNDLCIRLFGVAP